MFIANFFSIAPRYSGIWPEFAETEAVAFLDGDIGDFLVFYGGKGFVEDIFREIEGTGGAVADF